MDRKSKRTYQWMIVAFVLVCFAMGFACFQYYRSLQRTVKEENNGYMAEISNQMEINVSKTIEDNFLGLNAMALVLKNREMDVYDQFRAMVLDFQSHWNYQKILLIDESGIAYDEQGNTVALRSDPYLREVIVSKKASMSASQVIDGEECIVFAVPLAGIQMDGKRILALAGAYDLRTFDKILSMTAFDGKGYAHIIREDGTIVVRSSSPNAQQTGYNILRSLSGAKIANGQEIRAIEDAIANGQRGQMEFTLHDAHEYMTYTPLTGQEWSLLTFVPVSVVNEKSNLLLKITVLACSVITLAFAALFALLLLGFFRNKRRLERIAYVDPVTGGHTISRFYELAQELLSAEDARQYALIYTNIEKFKVLNEQFGKARCDKILCSIEKGIGSDLSREECMGRLFADNFCLLIRYTDEASMAVRLDRWQKSCALCMETSGSAWLPMIMEFGVYVIGNRSIALPHMIDRAKLSLSEATSEFRGKVRYTIYDERVRQLLFREKKLEDMMENALQSKEFEVYLQPKYHTQSEKIGGAEALARWRSPSEGMIYPNEFIALFEKNGFIVQLDLFVFEEVCRMIRRWIEEGKEPLKISVNCSRIQLKNPNFLRKYTQIARKYDIPSGIVEIELTENTVFENVEALSQIIRDIHLAGFGCSMDDFGSGYSSLNLIQDIPVDTLKLDKIFFHTRMRDAQRTESVVGSIIAMSKALSMTTVAEGVEERTQVDMLKRLDCDYIQGYYFAKPMPVAAFEQLAFQSMQWVQEAKEVNSR